MPTSLIGRMLYPEPFWSTAALTSTARTLLINATNDRGAWIVQAPKAGVLHSFEIRLSTVSDQADNGLRFSFQSLVTTTGVPDTTPSQFRVLTGTLTSNTWIAPPGILTDDGTDMGTPRTVVAGEWFACVIDFASFVTGDAISLVMGIANGQNVTTPMYIADSSTGTYGAKEACQMTLAVKYNDGSYAVFPFGAVMPTLTWTNTAFNVDSSGADEWGTRFKLPAKLTSDGWWTRINVSGDFTINLYNAAGSVVRSTVVDKDYIHNTQGWICHGFWNEGPIELEADTVYRLVITPTTTSNVTVSRAAVNASGLMAAIPGGVEWYTTNRINGGSWTDITTERTIMGLSISQVPSGAVGTSHGFFTG